MSAKSKTKIKKSPKMVTQRLDEVKKKLKGPKAVRVGLPKGANPYPDGPSGTNGTSVIMVGFVHEFGSPAKGIPQRSFLRSSIKQNRRKYKKMIRKLADKILQGKIDMKKAMQLLGSEAAGDVQERITEISTPPLKYRKGNPLVDSGHLRQSITYEVKDAD